MNKISLFSRRGLIAILIILALLAAACGGEEPGAEELAPAEPGSAEVVETQAPAAEEPPAEPAATEAPAGMGQVGDGYTHLTGQFQIQPVGEKLDEYRDGAAFQGPDGLQLVIFQGSSDTLDDSTATDLTYAALDMYLVESGLASEYSLAGDPAAFADGYLANFQATDANGAPTQGGVYLRHAGGTLYTVLLVSGDYAAAEAAFQQSAQSLAPAAGVEIGAAEADSGFRTDQNGFSFPNYTGQEFPVTDLTPVEMQRMFGPQVCASNAGGECILTPPAQRWMDDRNASMSGGHCEGFTVLSSLMYYGQVDPNEFGAPSVSQLQIQDNEMLQREIAYWFTTQYSQPGGINKINESPAAVVDALLQIFAEGNQPSEQFAVGIYKRDFQGGHSVLPIGVDDKGDGLYDILIYDNNYPGQTRAISVDTNANTWQYEASINPNVESDVYEGDASTGTLELVTISHRLDQQVCDFCSGTGGSSKGGRGLGQAAPEYYEVTLEGPANLMIETEDGKRIGYVDGQFINEIEGAKTEHTKLGLNVWDQDLEPVYRIPAGKTFTIAVDATELTEASNSSVSVIGPGFFMAIEDIELDAGEVDIIGITSEGQTYAVVYLTDYTETPEIYMGIETPEADYAFLASASDLPGAEDTLNIALDLENQLFVVTGEGNTEPGKFNFYVLRIDDEGESAFGTEDFELGPGQTVYLEYANWQGNDAAMVAQLDSDGDGQPDQVVDLPNMTDAFEW